MPVFQYGTQALFFFVKNNIMGVTYVAWMIGDVNKGVIFQLTSEQFTVEELLVMAESVQK